MQHLQARVNLLILNNLFTVPLSHNSFTINTYDPIPQVLQTKDL